MAKDTVTQSYVNGILEGRALKRNHPDIDVAEALKTAETVCRLHPEGTPLGDLARGERDFWLNQTKKD